MRGVAGGGYEGAHGEAVDQLVVKVLVVDEVLGGNAAGLRPGAVRRVDVIAGIDGTVKEGKGSSVDAEMVFPGSADPRLGINGAGQVVVQVAALGHAVEEAVERKWSRPARLIKGASGAGFRRVGRCLSMARLGIAGQSGQQEKQRGDRRKAGEA